MIFPNFNPRIFPALLIRAYDGDTVELVIDHGMGIHVKHPHSFRLYGIDTPEMRGRKADVEAAIAARDYALNWLLEPRVGTFAVTTHSRGRKTGYLDEPIPCFVMAHDGDDLGVDDLGKYGRWVVEIARNPRTVDDPTLNQALVDAGHAVLKTY